MVLTVAWELSWYQFVVDLSDGREPVRVRGQGQELAELPGEAQDWNCESAAQDGTVAHRAAGSTATTAEPRSRGSAGEPRSGP